MKSDNTDLKFQKHIHIPSSEGYERDRESREIDEQSKVELRERKKWEKN